MRFQRIYYHVGYRAVVLETASGETFALDGTTGVPESVAEAERVRHVPKEGEERCPICRGRGTLPHIISVIQCWNCAGRGILAKKTTLPNYDDGLGPCEGE